MKNYLLSIVVLLSLALGGCNTEDTDDTLEEYNQLIVGIFEPRDMMWSVEGERIYVFNKDKTGTIYVLESRDQTTRLFIASSVLTITNYYIERAQDNTNYYQIHITRADKVEPEIIMINQLDKDGMKDEIRRYTREDRVNVVGVE